MRAVQDSLASMTDSANVAAQLTLQPLYEPEPVSFDFAGPGWQILGGLIILVALIGFLFWLRSYRKNAYRRAALKFLEDLEPKGEIEPLFITLKNVAMQTFGRSKTAHLSGKEWLDFLDKTAEGTSWATHQKTIDAFLFQNISPEEQERKRLFENAKTWIRKHA
ncbi:DUF4381 domain-containing protein [Algoriphagus namhaensis]